MPTLLHFEDFTTGREFALGPYEMTNDEIVAFAREFDPQPMHLSEAAGAKSMLGGLAASGWHICAVFMRMAVDSVFSKSAFLSGVAVQDVRWLRPVYPGDRLTGKLAVLETRASSRDATRGYVRIKAEILRGAEPVARVVSEIMVAARGPHVV